MKILLAISSIVIGIFAGICHKESVENHQLMNKIESRPVDIVIIKGKVQEIENESEIVTETQTNEIIDDCNSCNWELDYLARCVIAEAGNQSELGKRLVIDVILNRIDADKFPNDIVGVINQEGQFACVTNNSINKCESNEYIYNLILEEMENRVNNEILYFRTLHYHTFGTPVMQEQDHYFSK